MRRPRAVGPGDRVAIVAPASPFSREEFDRGVDEIRRLGFEPIIDDRVFAARGYVAGEPELRARHLLDAWMDPTVAGILCARGGYGSAHLLPWLDLAALQRSPKVFVGYSDLTTLLTWITLHGQVVTFHGPMLAGRLSRGDEGYDRASFLSAVSSADPAGELCPPGLEVIREGEASGMLVGGTLTQLLASLATPYAFDPPAGHVLFVEDVNERPYRLDRMLTQLRFSGVLAKAAGIVFGELPGCDEPDGRTRARDVVRDVLDGFAGPVLMGFPSGHTTGPAWTIPLGVRATVRATASAPALIIDEPAVA